MERHSLTVASVGGRAPDKPTLTAEEKEALSRSVQSLTELLAPARMRGPELAVVIGKLFAAFNQFTGDAGKMNAQVDVWTEELEEFPPYAIRKAYRWAVRGSDKLPSLSAFIADVRLAVGSGVMVRQRMLRLL